MVSYKEIPDPHDFVGEFYQICKKEITPVVQKISENERRHCFPLHSMRLSLLLHIIYISIKESLANFHHDHICKNGNQDVNKSN